MTLIYPQKLSILSISTRWHSKEQKSWFCGYHILCADWDGHENWQFHDGHHVGFGLESTHLKLKSLAKCLDPTRHLLGFQLDVDVHKLCHQARLAAHPKMVLKFAQTLAMCMENCTDLADQFGGHAADIHAMAALRNDVFFKLNPADEDEGWESPKGQDPRQVGRYLRDRNAFLWFSHLRLTLNEQQISQALAAYFDWFYDKWPLDPLRGKLPPLGRKSP